MTRMDVTSFLCSLADISAQDPHWHFNVPIYQRLYVWGQDQVLTLLTDLINAHDRGESLFFLGGVLLVEQPGNHGRHFDLIDGQQRLTTLWMLCHAWGGALEPFLRVRAGDAWRPRLSFAIRPEVNDLLTSLLVRDPKASARPASDAGIERMGQAMATMHSALSNDPQYQSDSSVLQARLASVADFVFHKVKFTVTTVPRATDLNKLFEVINNRGVQLQHHEILKARMLESLTELERAQFSVQWDACADMDNYVERSLGGVSGIAAHELQSLHAAGKLGDGAVIRQKIALQHQVRGQYQRLALADILAGRGAGEDAAADDNAAGDAGHTARVRSIIGFPLLLEHVLRIWLFERDCADLPRVLDKELLSLFEEHFPGIDGDEAAASRADAVRSFIDLLWRLRVLFDEHVIKWVDQGSQELHLVSRIGVSTSNGRSYITRSRETDSHRGLSLLQSMLYHSQEITTQYWLTPFLMRLHRHAKENVESHFVYLQHLDNHLLGCEPNEPLVSRTASFMADPWQERPLIHQDALRKPLGVGFAHYWFYKLEFVLWDQRAKSVVHWQNFRFTAKNSVEHISPQTPSEHDLDRVKETLDCFGNLALVSRSINSEYGNKPYNEKRRRFLNLNRETVDSLKMDTIYRANKQWGDELAMRHQSEMLQCFQAYVESCKSKGRAARAA